MTTTVSPESAAHKACRDSGLPSNSLTHLHHHATAVYLLPAEGIVVRVSPAAQRSRLSTAVRLTRWLVSNGYPATEPVDLAQPVDRGPYVVTFWVHYPQSSLGTPPAGHLGSLLHGLHELPPPPVALPEYQPLSSLLTTVATSISLPPIERDWLIARCSELLGAYHELNFPLGRGLLHGDAYPGNTLWDGPNARLGDWDEAAIGPREIDLANTFQGARFGRPYEELNEFSLRYGYDISNWPGLAVLCKIRDLHTLGSYIRRADQGDQVAARELSYRIETLRNDDSGARWSAS